MAGLPAMSLTSRLLRPPIRLPATRAYSSFFSSNGGRHFNPAKTAKVDVAPKKNNGSVGSSGSKPSSDTSARVSSSADHSETKQDRSSSPTATATSSQPTMTTPTFAPAPQYHPLVGAKEFKLHQFFSLHRPLLLLSAEPNTILQSAPSNVGLFGTGLKQQEQQYAAPPSSFMSMSEAEADAETARQLTRALTMSQAGSMAEWENTLRRLGWDDGRAEVKAQMAEEYEVVMDSVKRKRRKKMKKHKLKKRRRLTRASRMKLR